MRKKKGYKFTDELMAKDTVFSFVFGIVALVIIVLSIVTSIALKGHVPEYIGSLLFASLIMGITSVFLLFWDIEIRMVVCLEKGFQ